MRAPVNSLVAELRRASHSAREKAAGEVLAPETVREAIHQAALLGRESWRIRVPDGLAVDGTAAEAALNAWAKRERLRITWESRHCDMPDGQRVQVAEPILSWGEQV